MSWLNVSNATGEKWQHKAAALLEVPHEHLSRSRLLLLRRKLWRCTSGFLFPFHCYNQISDGLHSRLFETAPFVTIAVECNKFNQVFTDLKCMKCAKVLETFRGQNMYRTGRLKHIKANKLIWSCILFTAAGNFPYLRAIKSPPRNNKSWRANRPTLSACTPKSVISLFLSSARWNKKRGHFVITAFKVIT